MVYMSDTKDSTVLLHLAHKGLLALNLDINTLFHRMGITPELLKNRNARIPHIAQNQFWKLLEIASEDKLIGFNLGQAMPLYRGQVLQYLFLSSPNFGDGLRRAINYRRILSDALDISLDVGSKTSRIFDLYASDNEKASHHLSECLTVNAVRFFKYMTEDHFQATGIYFRHTSISEDVVKEYEDYFKCPVIFSANENMIEFNSDVLSYQSIFAQPELLNLHEKLAREHMIRIERQDIIDQVYKIFSETLESGEVNLEIVANRLNIKARTLRTRLMEADTHFNKLLANYRCYLAKQLLAKTNESIDEIVYLTGFSEPSTFYRAFKRWAKKTPIEYRRYRQQMIKSPDTYIEN